MRENTFYPDNLVWIRKRRGLNKTALAKLIDVDLRSISAYESGEYAPSPEKASLLTAALDVGSDFFAKQMPAGPDASQVSFRSYSKLSATKRDMALGTIAISFAFHEWVINQFNLPLPDVPDLREEGKPEQAAMSLRYMWGLGEQPIPNMVHLLESKGIKVFSMRLDMHEVDACCTWKDNHPFIFLNSGKSNARRRFDAAHELAHLVLHRHGDYAQAVDLERDGSSQRLFEKEADDFASEFLMPRKGFLASAPTLPNLPSIFRIKQHWGVSLAAAIYRLHKIGIITDWHYRTLFQQISQKGYRRKEPNDSPSEMSQFADLLLKFLREDGKSLRDAACDIGVKETDITDLLFDLALIPIEGNSFKTQRTPSTAKLKLVKG